MKKLCSILLFPLGAVYGIIGLIRRRLYKTGLLSSYRSTLPTICIGNLTVGGTGKTPMVEYLIRLLRENRHLATLSRGYKRKTSGYLNSGEAGVEVTATTFGDEPTQLHHKFPDVQVVVCESRAEGLRQLERAATPPDLVLLDDAYQHLPVRCDLNLLLTDYSRLYCDDFPMPAGRLREFPSAATHADGVVVTKCPSSLTTEEAEIIRKRLKINTKQRCFFTTLVYDELTPATSKAREFTLTNETPIVALSGIANPTSFVQEISRHFSDIEQIEYGDHHTFTHKEVAELCKKMAEKSKPSAILTTEKDLVRLRAENLISRIDTLPVFVLPVRMRFLFEEEEEFIRLVNQFQ